jgi:hypothetical protein
MTRPATPACFTVLTASANSGQAHADGLSGLLDKPDLMRSASSIP